MAIKGHHTWCWLFGCLITCTSTETDDFLFYQNLRWPFINVSNVLYCATVETSQWHSFAGCNSLTMANPIIYVGFHYLLGKFMGCPRLGNGVVFQAFRGCGYPQIFMVSYHYTLEQWANWRILEVLIGAHI